MDLFNNNNDMPISVPPWGGNVMFFISWLFVS